MNNSQVAHVWAQQGSKTSARGSNFYFNDENLISYNTVIARFVSDGAERIAVISLHKYSNTTMRHQSYALRAVSHRAHYTTAHEIKHLPRTWTEIAPILVREQLAGISDQINEIKRARAYVKSRLDRLVESVRSTQAFLSRYFRAGFSFDGSVLSGDQFMRLSSATCDETLFYAILHADHQIDVNILLEKEREHDARQARKRETRRLQWEREYAERIAERTERERISSLTLPEKCEQWRAHTTSAPICEAPVMLRLSRDGASIETSHGASVPLDQAIALYRAVMLGADISGRAIGHFTAQGVNDGIMTVGCHKIPTEEMLRLALALGISTNTEIVAAH
jgi:hypothetical protein